VSPFIAPDPSAPALIRKDADADGVGGFRPAHSSFPPDGRPAGGGPEPRASGTPLPASLRLYALAARAASVLAPTWLRARVRRGKEDPRRWGERLGRTGLPRPPGRLAWLHGASVGESLSLLPLAERLRAERPDAAVLVTSGTLAAAELLSRRLPEGAIHQFAPLDTPDATRRFLGHWRPDLVVFAESELWPNLILGARRAGARLALLSALLSDRSLAGWRRAPAAARVVLGAFDLLLARDEAAADRFRALGARVDGLANLKFGAAPLPADASAWAQARQVLGDRPVILAASTHPGEDEIILEAFRAAMGAARPLLIVAPRHPIRGEAVERLALDLGLAAARRGTGARVPEEGPGAALVYVADTVGELGLWRRLARLEVLGGSFTPGGAGGHNPLEAARLGCPFIAGPWTEAWPIYDGLESAGATRRVAPADLAGWFARAIAEPSALRAMAERAKAFVAAGDAGADLALARVMALLAR
jgi:3-deoxy-D-manno-octulosonic-acid transferase